ncbi:MAG: DUF481 domain-containing protein [Verrucomicrobiales bacterium]
MSNPTILILLLLLTAPAVVGAADVVKLKNGDRISGEVTRMKDGDLKIKTAYAGEIVIQWAEVAKLEMGEPVRVLLDDQSVTEADTIAGAADPSGKSTVAALDAGQVEIINPTPQDLGEKGTFTGSVNIAAKLESGNTNKDEIDADYDLTYRLRKYRFRSHGQLEYDNNDGRNSKRDWMVLNNADYFLTDRSYLSAWFGVTQEYYKGLDLRTLIGPSYGIQFYQGKPTNLLSELGIFYIDEDYSTVPDEEWVGPGWLLKLDHELFGGDLRFYHKHYTVVNWEDTGKVLWHSWTGVSVPLFENFVTSLEFEADYDSRPALNDEDLDTTVRLKLGYEW